MKQIIKRILKLLTSVSLLAAIAVTLFLYTQSHPRDGRDAAVGGAGEDAVRFRAEVETIVNSVEIRGKSSYVKETVIYAPFSADVKRWHVEDGAEVRAGDPLFELDTEKLEKDLALAEARILQQQLELKLMEKGEESGNAGTDVQTALQNFAGKEELRIKKQLKEIELGIARDALNENRERLQKAVFPAPDDGIFLFAGDNKPQSLEQDKPVGRIVDLSELQLVSEIGEFEVFRVREGMEAEVRIDALPDRSVRGEVRRVSKFAKAGTGQSGGEAKFEIIVALEHDPGLIAGLSLTGKIVTDRKENALVVPTIAVLRDDSGHYVYVEGPAGVERRPVKIGIETADKTEVLEGLSEGETVVLR